MTNSDSTTGNPITSASLPAILIGGPPQAGKSILTYNLTLALRHLGIPHYVFRASADIEGDWSLRGDPSVVGAIQRNVKIYRKWTDAFRELIGRDLPQRQMPLLVDLGGEPKDADIPIFQACTHSLLLLKEDEEVNQKWRRLAAENGLKPLAELSSRQGEQSVSRFEGEVLKGTISGLAVDGLMEGKPNLHNDTFDQLLELVREVLQKYSADELERFHLQQAPLVPVVADLPRKLRSLAPDSQEWLPALLPRLLTTFPAETAIAVYGRAPAWVYATLAIHADTQPFHQFDARLGWIDAPDLQVGPVSPALSMHIEERIVEERTNASMIFLHPVDNYLDYEEAAKLTFPELKSDDGLIITGKLPLWLFTALTRFYAQGEFAWIALNDARTNKPIVVYSQVDSHRVGDVLPQL